MRTISIKQPWAELIISGVKDVENRTWSTDYRGPILIHAGKRVDPAGADRYPAEMSRCLKSNSLGAIVGCAFLYGCTQKQRSQWHEAGFWGWYLADPISLPEPIPWVGQLSLFDIDLIKITPAITLCTRCKANLPTRGHGICSCCLWYLNESTDRMATAKSQERWLYGQYLNKKCLTAFAGRKVQ